MSADRFEVVVDQNDQPWLLIGDRRRLPTIEAEAHDFELVEDDAIPIMRTRRVLLTFETGLDLSIIWGSGTYSTNHMSIFPTLTGVAFQEMPTTVEVAVLRGDDILGVRAYQTVDEVLAMIDMVNRGDVPVLEVER